MSMSGWKWNKNWNKMGKIATICDPPQDFKEWGECTHTARSHAKAKGLIFNALAAC